MEGFLSPLKVYKKWSKKNVLLIGCGGSAKAVVHALGMLKVSKITIVNRNIGKKCPFALA